MSNCLLMAVVWPYTDCMLFTKGAIVFYKKIENEMLFWHPHRESWEKSIRPNILEDTCSISTISMKMMKTMMASI